jgi:hypothetical protein
MTNDRCHLLTGDDHRELLPCAELAQHAEPITAEYAPPVTAGLGYWVGAKLAGVPLRFCPFCGAKISPEDQAQSREENPHV